MNLNVSNDNFVKIRPLTIKDFYYVLRWSKDNTFCSANDWDEDRDEQELYEWWRYCVNNVSEDFIRLGIEVEDTLVGYIDLACIKGSSAELGIAIGDSMQWGKGIGFNSSILMMQYASTHLGITVFNAETHETNIRARKMLKKIGFKEVSRMGSEKYLGIESKLIQYRFSL